MKDINIRYATAADVPVIHALLCELEKVLGAGAKIKRKQEDLLRYGFSDEPFFQALIAYRGAEPVGLALFFREFSSWRGQPGVYLQDLYVAADTRGTGLGRELMKAVYEQARQWGATYCKLAVDTDNESAIAFYERLGFAVTDNERFLMRDGLDNPDLN